MKRSIPGSWPLWGLPVFLAVGMLPGQELDGLELQVRYVDEAGTLLTVPLRPGETFTLHYRHSVDGGPIWEVHSVDRAGTIFIEEERFTRFGAGMGHWPGHGRLTRRGACQVIEGIHRPIGRPILRIGSPAVGHTLIWRGQRIMLSALAPGRRVQLVARPAGLVEFLWRRIVSPRSPSCLPEAV